MGEKNLSAASELFHLEENLERKSSKVVLFHSWCIAPPVTQAILVFFQLWSPVCPGTLAQPNWKKIAWKGCI